MDYSFGKWVKHSRKAVDLTQWELAFKVGCSSSMIFKIEADRRRPSLQIAHRLATYLEIPPEQHEQFIQFARLKKP